MTALRILGVGLVAAVWPRLAQAQRELDRAAALPPPQAYLGLSFQIGEAKGQFADYVDVGWGGGGYLLYRPSGSALGVRLGVMYLVYGSQTHRYPLVPGVSVDVTTRNQIGQFSLGPEITLGQGVVQPYGFGAIGGSFFYTTSGVEGSDQTNQQFASTTNYHDGTFSGEYGGGVQIRLSAARVPIFADIGLRYLNNGRITYVTKERVTISGTQLLVDPVDSEANLLVYHLGVTIGLRRSPHGEEP